MTLSCQTCRFGEKVNEVQTKCLRFPPVPILLNVKRDEEGRPIGHEAVSLHPINGPTIWCGEHQAKVEDVADV